MGPFLTAIFRLMEAALLTSASQLAYKGASMSKKKVLITAMTLNIGGAEKSLVNLLNLLDYEEVDVDLLLFQRWGDLIDQVPDEVNQISVPEIDVLYGGKPAVELAFGKRTALKVLRYAASAMTLVAEKEFDRQRIWRWMHSTPR